jgi:hypothetical protein
VGVRYGLRNLVNLCVLIQHFTSQQKEMDTGPVRLRFGARVPSFSQRTCQRLNYRSLQKQERESKQKEFES